MYLPRTNRGDLRGLGVYLLQCKKIKTKIQSNSCSILLLYCKILYCLVINYTEIVSFAGGYEEQNEIGIDLKTVKRSTITADRIVRSLTPATTHFKH